MVKLRETVPKVGGQGPHREVTAGQTYERVRPHLGALGITRVADITGLDRLGIPVYNAIVPRSADALSVYNGKGRTSADARVSAVMEAVERFCAWQPRTPRVVASHADLVAHGVPALDPADCCLAIDRRYRPEIAMSWVAATDLGSGEEVLVPGRTAGYYTTFHELGPHHVNTTTGLASGNSLEEAVCHALAEVVERDDWTMAELVSNRLKRVVAEKMGAAAPPGAVRWLEDRHPQIDQATLPPSARELADRFAKAGVRLVLRDISAPDGVAAVAAISVEHVADTFSGAHAGYAAHPDAEVAVVRAITEVAQSRAVDIQGMREDLELPGKPVEAWNVHVRRGSPDLDLWPYREAHTPRSFDALPHRPSDDVAADTRVLCDVLRGRGLDRVLVVDLSPAWLPVKVVRVIVPGAESYGIDQSKLGPRSGRHWDATLRALIARRDGAA